jgi:hypothetical protein
MLELQICRAGSLRKLKCEDGGYDYLLDVLPSGVAENSVIYALREVAAFIVKISIPTKRCNLVTKLPSVTVQKIVILILIAVSA